MGAGGGVFILDSSRLQQRWLTVRQRELLMDVCGALFFCFDLPLFFICISLLFYYRKAAAGERIEHRQLLDLAVEQLDALIRDLERGELPLEAALAAYKQGAELATQRVWMGDKSEIKLGTDRDISLVVPRNSSGKLKADFQLKNELNAPIKKGEQVGTIFLKLDGKDVAQYPLVALEEVNEGSLFSRLWDYLVLLFQRLLS